MSERWLSFRFRGKQTERLDKYLVTCLPKLSRSQLQNLVRDNHVLVNGNAARKSGQMLGFGDLVQVYLPPVEPSILIPEAIPLEIIFENEDLMVVNKPAGMVVHPAAGHTRGTLVHAALAHAPEMNGVGGVKRPGVVHRLDKDTSGLILLAKNDQAQRWLQDQFRYRKAQKIYIALVDGQPPTPSGRIDAPIGRDLIQRKRMAVTSLIKGRTAVSEYHTLERYKAHTLLEVHPITGRTHQIRLHLAYIGCPIAGDKIYGLRHATIALDRHFLHAGRLTILLPGETKPRTFEAALPKELVDVLVKLREDSTRSDSATTR